MKTGINIQAETDEEIEVIDMLTTARQIGLEEAEMDPEDLANLFSLFAVGIIEGQEVEQRPEFECPHCGEGVFDHESAEMGGDPVLQPCGCQVPWVEIPNEYEDEHFGLGD